jgi:20S proteasome subunit beta 6
LDCSSNLIAIAGEDFAVIAGDTRLTDGSYGINTRYAPKVFEVGDDIVITANGYSADGDTLVKRIAQKIEVKQSSFGETNTG